MVNQEATKPPTKEEAKAALQAYGYENIDFHEDESGILSGTHQNGLPIRIAGSDVTGWFEVHGGICAQWLERGGPTGELGLPLSNEEPDPDYREKNGRRSRFQHGTIHCWPADPTNLEDKWDVDVELSLDSSKTPSPAMEMSEKTRAKLEKFDEELNQVKAIQANLGNEEFTAEARRAFEEALSEIVRRRRAFDSKTFFMVTFGMLKAGKSTLVNTFVGKEVSPVGRSKETTLRSSVILAADGDSKEGIYLYSPKNGASGNTEEAVFKWRRQNCAAMMDFLDGMTTRDEFLVSFKEDIYPFTEQILERLLTEETIPEFPNILPPVIRIDPSRTNADIGAANLLKDGVAIFDTPGLDGARANKDSDPFWRILPSNGDYFLLVQSSMSAINKDCLSLVTDIYRATKDAPVLVVFNEIASNFWLLPEVEKMKLRDDSETASKELSNQLLTALGGILPARVSINAGEASDAVFGRTEEFRKNVPAMIDESRIRNLRDRIVRTLREERGAIKERNATNRMVKALNEAIATIEEARMTFIKSENTIFNAASSRRSNASTTATDLSNAFHSNGVGVNIARAIGQRFTDLLNTAFNMPSKPNPYSEDEGFGRNRKDKHNYLEGDVVDGVLADTRDAFIKTFRQSVGKVFVGGNLPIGQTPWQTTMQQIDQDRTDLEEMRVALTTGVDSFVKATALDRRFPDSLFQDFNTSAILQFLDFDDFVPACPTIPRVQRSLFRNRPYGDDTVWECECARSFEKLIADLKATFPGKAAERAGEGLRDVIIEKGSSYTKGLSVRLQNAIQSDQNDSDQRKSDADSLSQRLVDAVSHMEEMKRILVED